MMKSINVVIDDAITKVATDDSGEGTSFKKAIVEIEAQDVTSCQFFFFLKEKVKARFLVSHVPSPT